MRNLVRVRVVRPRSLLVALTVCSAVAPATPASALDVGFDVSFPQCGGALPALGAFAMNLANPGPDVSTHWPRGQATPRECDMPPRPGADTADCAYDYGWNAASDAYATAVAAYVSLGLVAPGATATPAPVAWWLDVERANTWRTGASLNVAAIQGAVERLRSAGALLVGIYSSSAGWQAITDAAVFPELPSWVAGPGTRAEAEASCVDDQGFTTGGVGMVQSPSEGFDANVRCPPDLAIASAPAAVSAGAPSRAIVARVRPVQPIPVQMTLSTGSRAPLLAPTAKLRVVVTVTNQTKRIANGVVARVVRDVVSQGGDLVEVTDDWYAQDGAGNIWYLGEATKDYENGKVVSTSGSFEAGVDGAQAGVVMPANPRVGMAYRQEYYAGKAEDRAEVFSLREQVEVPSGHFSKVVMTRDLNPLKPRILEYKFYARGVGPVLILGVSGGSAREELVSFRRGR